MLIKRRRKNMLSIPTTTGRQTQLWNIIVVIFLCVYTSLHIIDTYLSNFQSRRQEQRIISIEELHGQLYPSYRQYILPSLPVNIVFDDMVRSNDLDWQQSTNKSSISEMEDLAALHEADIFPRWKGSIGLKALHSAIDVSMSGKLRFDRSHRVYVVSDHGEMYHVNIPRSAQADQAPYRRARTMEKFAIQVLEYVRNRQNDNDDTGTQYPYLNAILREGGFAYIANYADSKFCADTQPFIDENWQPLLKNDDIAIVPIFTLSSPIHCQRAFPIPTYETIEQSKSEWNALIPFYCSKYKRSEQIRKAIWRGAPTGDRFPHRNTRIQLCIHGSNRPDILDTRIVKRRAQWNDTVTSSSTTTNRTGNVADNATTIPFDDSKYLGSKMLMEDFQTYRAIIDVDGHSWSSRFGKLMCYNSVILKVQPDDVDYFHPQLQPWVHYIPIHSNLSNLYDMVTYAVSDNPTIVQTIHNANAWCLQHMSPPSLIHDMANIWDRYSYHLLLQYQNETNDTGSTHFSRLQQPDVIESSSSYGVDWRNRRQELFRTYNFTPIYG